MQQNSVISIAAGGYHSLALRRDGTVVAWGSNVYGQTNVPIALSNVMSVAAGTHHSLALKTDGTITGWGLNRNLQAEMPQGVSNVMAITAGLSNSVALLSNGTVIAWGGNQRGQTNVPVGLSNVVSISACHDHVLALKQDGSIVVWGDIASRGVPAGLENATAIAAGERHDLALVASGPPKITTRPTSQTGALGDSVTFSVAAEGNAPLSYQWALNGFYLADGEGVQGSTNATLTLTNLAYWNVGTYTAIVRNSLGAAGSSADLVVQDHPNILEGLVDIKARPGDTVSMSFTYEGTSPMGIQWSYQGNDLIGETNDVLILTNVQPESSGSYGVLVYNDFGNAFSWARLNVLSTPYIESQPQDTTVAAGMRMSLWVYADGAWPLSYQWVHDGTNIQGSSFLSITNPQAWDAGEYYVIVTNSYGSVESAHVFLEVVDSPPVLSLKSGVEKNCPLGSSLTITGKVYGTAPLFCQWRQNGRAIEGATNTVLTLNRLEYDHTGNYDWVVSNSVGVTFSSKVPVAVVQTISKFIPEKIIYRPPPANAAAPPEVTNLVAVSAATNQTLGLKADGTVAAWAPTNTYLTNLPAGISNVVAISASSQCSLFLKKDGTVQVFSHSYYGFTNLPAGATNIVAISAADDHCLAVRGDGRVIGWGSGPGAKVPAAASNAVAVAAGKFCNLALREDGTIVDWSSSITALPKIPILSNIMFVATSTRSNYAFRVDGTVLTWSSDAGSYTNIVPVTPKLPIAAIGGFLSILADGTLWPTTYATYTNLLMVTYGTSYVLLFGDGSPFITVQPFDHHRVIKGRNVELSARIVGSQPMDYQWQLNNRMIPGATNFSLIVSNAQESDAGAYSLVASNALGQTTTRAAVLDFAPPQVVPTFFQHPVSRTAPLGSNVVFEAGASSTEAFSYQWLKNGETLVGATQACLTLNSVARHDSGVYAAKAFNDSGAVLSSNAVLRVLVPQQMRKPEFSATGDFLIVSSDADLSLLAPGDLGGFALEMSSNLVSWASLTNRPVLQNGNLKFHELMDAKTPSRFYRIVEQ